MIDKNCEWIKVETTIDDLLDKYDVKKIIGYEDGFAYVELNEHKNEHYGKANR